MLSFCAYMSLYLLIIYLFSTDLHINKTNTDNDDNDVLTSIKKNTDMSNENTVSSYNYNE